MKRIKVTEIEQGKNFITLYFKTARDNEMYSKRLYSYFKTNRYFEIQRKDFKHELGDVLQFHPEGSPVEAGRPNRFHFHIIYPNGWGLDPKKVKRSYDFIYKWGNRIELQIDKNIKIEQNKGEYNGNR